MFLTSDNPITNTYKKNLMLVHKPCLDNYYLVKTIFDILKSKVVLFWLFIINDLINELSPCLTKYFIQMF